MAHDRFCREREREHITGISRSHWWRLEKEGKVPKRRVIGPNSVAWLASELHGWVQIRAAGKEWEDAA